jgi:pimeloyl-ACP methyl ester carboxylesterase
MPAAMSAVRFLLNGTNRVAPTLAGRGALIFFRFPFRRSAVRLPERETHGRAVTERLTVNGKPVVVYRWGTGERPVLLLHGWQSRASRFSEFVDALQLLGLSPIAFDAPGNGDSGGRTTTIFEYHEIASALQAKYGVFESVIAHSFGVLSTFYALRNGLQAKSFVALAGASDFDFLVDEFCGQLGLDAEVNQSLRRELERQVFPDTSDMWSRFDAKQFISEISIPILVIHDRQDLTVPFSQAEQLQAAYGSQLELIATTGLGHRLLAIPNVVRAALTFVSKQDQKYAA